MSLLGNFNRRIWLKGSHLSIFVVKMSDYGILPGFNAHSIGQFEAQKSIKAGSRHLFTDFRAILKITKTFNTNNPGITIF